MHLHKRVRSHKITFIIIIILRLRFLLLYITYIIITFIIIIIILFPKNYILSFSLQNCNFWKLLFANYSKRIN